MKAGVREAKQTDPWLVAFASRTPAFTVLTSFLVLAFIMEL